MNEITTILRDDLSHIIAKNDVWLVYTTKSKKPFVIVKNSIEYDNDLIHFVLARRISHE